MKYLAGVYLFPIRLSNSQASEYADLLRKISVRGTVVPALELIDNSIKHLRIEIHPEKMLRGNQNLYDTYYSIRIYDKYGPSALVENIIGKTVLKDILSKFSDSPGIVVTLVKHREEFYAKASVYMNMFDNCKSTETIRGFDKNHITTIYCSRLLDTDLSYVLEAENYPLGLSLSEIGSMTTEQLNAYARLRNLMYSLSKRLDAREQEIALSLIRYLHLTGLNFLAEIDGKLLGYKSSTLVFDDNILRQI